MKLSEDKETIIDKWSDNDEKLFNDIKQKLKVIDNDVFNESGNKEVNNAKLSLLKHKIKQMNSNDLVNQHNELIFDFYKKTSKTMKEQDSNFVLQPAQKFVKKFLSPYTGNTGILLFHKLGSGKTCSALQIGLNFLDFFDNKILVIGRENLLKNFTKEIFDYSNINENKQFNGCIGRNLLERIVPDWRKESENIINYKMKMFINSNFELTTPGTLFNEKNTNMDTRKYIHEIQEKYSDRVIIVDEAHGVRDENKNDDQQKKVTKILSDIMIYAKNVRLVLLSATPMYNEVKDLYDIMDLLMLNDKSINVNNNKSKSKRIVNDKDIAFFAKNYVSYLSGNYLNYPVKINPSLILKKEEVENKVLYIDNDDKKKALELYKTNMSDEQKFALKSSGKNDNDNDKNSDSYDKDKKKISTIRRQISNFCPPSLIKKLESNTNVQNISFSPFVKEYFTFDQFNKIYNLIKTY